MKEVELEEERSGKEEERSGKEEEGEKRGGGGKGGKFLEERVVV